jgi:hypothetical protein
MAPFKFAGEVIIWALIIYGVIQMAQIIAFLIRGYYTLKFMKQATQLGAQITHQLAELHRKLPDDIARAEERFASYSIPVARPVRQIEPVEEALYLQAEPVAIPR